MRRWLQPRRYLHAAFGQLRTPGLCQRDVPITTARDAIGWWEARRVPFNLIVGSAGIFTCIVMGVIPERKVLINKTIYATRRFNRNIDTRFSKSLVVGVLQSIGLILTRYLEVSTATDLCCDFYLFLGAY